MNAILKTWNAKHYCMKPSEWHSEPEKGVPAYIIRQVAELYEDGLAVQYPYDLFTAEASEKLGVFKDLESAMSSPRMLH